MDETGLSSIRDGYNGRMRFPPQIPLETDELEGPLQATPESQSGDLVVPMLDREHAVSLLRALQHPINYSQPLEPLLDDLLLAISDTSGMPFIVIRYLDSAGSALRCFAT